MIQQTITSCDDVQCFLVAEHFFEYFKDDTGVSKFDRVLLDLAGIYENGVLVGAAAASKYVQPPILPRVTFDIDLVLDDRDFDEFINERLDGERAALLENLFSPSDSVNHSLVHRRTGIYVDFMSAESRPVRRALTRYIIDNKEQATNLIHMNGSSIQIAKPELIIAMKLSRYAKKPRTEKGLADRLDIVKIMKSYYGRKELLDPDRIREFANRREAGYLEEIMEDVYCDVCGVEEESA